MEGEWSPRQVYEAKPPLELSLIVFQKIRQSITYSRPVVGWVASTSGTRRDESSPIRALSQYLCSTLTLVKPHSMRNCFSVSAKKLWACCLIPLRDLQSASSWSPSWRRKRSALCFLPHLQVFGPWAHRGRVRRQRRAKAVHYTVLDREQ